MSIEGEVRISLQDFQGMQRDLDKAKERVVLLLEEKESLFKGAAEIQGLLNFLSSKVPNFQTLINSFNGESENVEVRKNNDRFELVFKHEDTD